jgi:hypothetical protein
MRVDPTHTLAFPSALDEAHGEANEDQGSRS